MLAATATISPSLPTLKRQPRIDHEAHRSLPSNMAGSSARSHGSLRILRDEMVHERQSAWSKLSPYGCPDPNYHLHHHTLTASNANCHTATLFQLPLSNHIRPPQFHLLFQFPLHINPQRGPQPCNGGNIRLRRRLPRQGRSRPAWSWYMAAVSMVKARSTGPLIT